MSDLWLDAVRNHRAVLKHRDAQRVLLVARLSVTENKRNAWDSSHRPMHAISLLLHCTAEGLALVHRLPSVHETLSHAFASVIADTPGNSLVNLSYEWSRVSNNHGAYRGDTHSDLSFGDRSVVEREVHLYLSSMGKDTDTLSPLPKPARILVDAAPLEAAGLLRAYFLL